MKKYRVEAFIIPTNVNCPSIKSNQIDDEKLAIKLKEKSFSEEQEEAEEEIKVDVAEKEEKVLSSATEACEKDDESEKSDLSGVFFDVDEHIYDEIKVPQVSTEKKQVTKVETTKEASHTEYSKAYLKIEEPIYDEPFIGNLTSVKFTKNSSNSTGNGNNNYDVPQTRWTLASSKYRRFGIVAPKLPKRSSSLQSIVEDIEGLEESLQEDLCCHGRKNGCLPGTQRPQDISDEIFKENWMQRLDALRKLETLLKDKEVALQSRERLLFKKEKELRILERLVKDKMKQAELYAKRHRKALSAESVTMAYDDRKSESRSLEGHVKSDGSLTSKANSRASLDSKEDKVLLRNPPNSRSSLVTDSRMGSRIGSMRSRPRHKIRYEDLDSTLSADVGDQSFVVTSKKFDPVIFKKPLAFTRSASERRPRPVEQSIAVLPIKNLIEKNCEFPKGPIDVLEEKTLKKMSENVIASQNQESKFLNYGLIDGDVTTTAESQEKKDAANQKKFSYLNLESINKSIKLKIKPKDRPVSWSEETDDWLKKKRQAYNMSTRNMTTIESTNYKENFDRSKKMNKSTKVTKKKDSSQKRFSIFR